MKWRDRRSVAVPTSPGKNHVMDDGSDVCSRVTSSWEKWTLAWNFCWLVRALAAV